jgi:hypothetical protein
MLVETLFLFQLPTSRRGKVRACKEALSYSFAIFLKIPAAIARKSHIRVDQRDLETPPRQISTLPAARSSR